MSIREKLGLGPKTEPNQTNLPEGYLEEGLAAKQEAAKVATAGPDVVLDGLPTDDLDREDERRAALSDDERLAEDMAKASEKLDTLELSAGAWSLIDRATDSMQRQTGAGLDDPDAKADAKARAALLKIADNDLSVCVQAIIAGSATEDAPGNVYGFLYAVLKSATFFGNLDYRMAEGMDIYADEATVEQFFANYVSSTYVEEALARVVGDQVLLSDDSREAEQDERARSDMGFESRRNVQIEGLRELYGASEDEPGEAVKQALRDVQMMFQLQTEMIGWPVDRPMPFGNVAEPNGTFTPIYDVQTALDAVEIKREAAKVKRRERRAAAMSGAQAAAAAIIAKSMQRPTVHQRKK